MKKLRPKLEELTVDSFETERLARARGTVEARSNAQLPTDVSDPQPTIATAQWTVCQDSCETCDASICQSCYFNTCYAGCEA